MCKARKHGKFISRQTADLGCWEQPMMHKNTCTRAVAMLALGLIVLVLHSDQALAQWGMGYGWGWGGLGMRNVPSPSDYLNQHALTRAAAGAQGVPSRTPYSSSSNAYFNRVRDNGFVSHYDVRRRQAPAYQPARGDAPATERRAVSPLASFFDASQRLVWPSESPTAGDLQEKRDRSDEASRAVLQETKQQTTASLSSVTYARQQLIDYGQPAIRELQSQSTAAIVDGFHRFLLGLYDSLAQAGWPAQSKTGSAPNP
jgi:hypothetical protein